MFSKQFFIVWYEKKLYGNSEKNVFQILCRERGVHHAIMRMCIKAVNSLKI